MSRKLLAVVAGILLVFSLSIRMTNVSYAQGEANQELAALLQELKEMKKEQKRLELEAQRLKKVDVDLKKKTEEWRKEKNRIIRDQNRVKVDLSKVDRQIRTADEYCKGKFYRAEYRRRKAECDAKRSNLFQRKKQLIHDLENIGQRSINLQGTIRAISRDTEQWTNYENQRRADSQSLREQQESWAIRYQNYIGTRSYRRLVQQARMSEECKRIAESAPEDFERNLDGALERAHRCLQKIWHGAR